MRRFAFPTLAAFVLIALTVTFTACGHDASERAPRNLPTAQVQVESVAPVSEQAFIETVGRVKKIKESVLASKTAGMVTKVAVKAGDTVKRGDLLMHIDDMDVMGRVQEARGALAQADAALKIAKSNLKRFEDLHASGSASDAELEKAQYDAQAADGAAQQARGALQAARSMAREARVAAPFDGRVVDTMIEVGELVSPGRPLVKIEAPSGLEFVTDVSERDAPRIQIGQAVEIELDSSNPEHPVVNGEVSEIVPSTDERTHTQTVRINLAPDEGLRSGLFGRARFPRLDASHPTPVVNADRVVRYGQVSGVYIVDPTGTVRLRLVREGRTLGDKVEIVSGLSEGDRIVASSLDGLIDGQPAKVVDHE
ncbi:MAG: efflux RND transporter periplasmic adaptor subunit [Deltaproteobacteria bacterium]|nr:efflux RND transporter periplasmic adaptor subunit [Deltaproteobacteria bacterium]MCB9487362.1 efflux RND transporter periplasmic adaptor subunit [Deltaproteobacteria bacterium]